MTSSDRFRVPLASLDAVHVPVEEQVESEPATRTELLTPEELDQRMLLVNPSGAGRLDP